MDFLYFLFLHHIHHKYQHYLLDTHIHSQLMHILLDIVFQEDNLYLAILPNYTQLFLLHLIHMYLL